MASECVLNGVLFLLFVCFFFNDTATTEIYTLSLHDALPICAGGSLLRPALPIHLLVPLHDLGLRALGGLLPHAHLVRVPERLHHGDRLRVADHLRHDAVPLAPPGPARPPGLPAP